MIETASDLGASGKEVELGEKEDHEKDETVALLVLEQIQIEEKTSFGRFERGRIETDCWCSVKCFKRYFY